MQNSFICFFIQFHIKPYSFQPSNCIFSYCQSFFCQSCFPCFPVSTSPLAWPTFTAMSSETVDRCPGRETWALRSPCPLWNNMRRRKNSWKWWIIKYRIYRTPNWYWMRESGKNVRGTSNNHLGTVFLKALTQNLLYSNFLWQSMDLGFTHHNQWKH